MALEPLMPSLDDGENPEFTDFRRRFWWTLPLSVTTMLLAMAGMSPALHALSPGARTWLELALATPVVLWAGWPFLVRWQESIRNRHPNMWTLIGTGVIAAYGYSVVATLAPHWFPASFHEHGRVGVYFEAAAMIVSLTLLGQLLELKHAPDLRGNQGLLGLAPKTARRLHEMAARKIFELVPCAPWRPLRVRPGEKVPVDGRGAGRPVAPGRIHADRRVDAVSKSPGDPVIGCHAEHLGQAWSSAPRGWQRQHAGADVQLGGAAQRSRAPCSGCGQGCVLVRWAVLAAALLTLLGWGLLGPEPSGTYGVLNALSADHRLSVRAGLATPVDHGSPAPCRAGWRAVSRRRSDRDLAQGGYADRRQDRHPDEGRPAFPGIGAASARPPMVATPRRHLYAGSEHPLRMRLWPRRAGAGTGPTPARTSSRPVASGRAGSVDGHALRWAMPH